jgi:DNA-binding transcriptional LysR family regulator
MDLRQLNALLAVADKGSFSGAARALHTVQSNVSTHVARLERELGATLIDRTTGKLTAEGEVVVARARRVQAELESLVADVTSLHSEISGNVRVGVIGTTARWLVPRLMQAMAERHPKVHVVVVDATTSSLLPQLETGRLDLAVVNLPVPDIDVIVTETLFEEDHLIVAPPGHVLHARQRVALDELAGIPLLLEPQGTGFRDHLDAQAAQAGVTLDAVAEVDGMRLLASLAFEGFGATIVPASAAPGDEHPTWRVALDGISRRAVGLACRRKGLLSTPARALRDVLTAVIGGQAPEPGIHPVVEAPPEPGPVVAGDRRWPDRSGQARTG